MHADKLAEPGNNLGVWEDGGNYYLDVSQVGTRSSETLQKAIDAKQLAVFDLGTFQEIKLGKNNKQGVYTALYEATNHPDLNSRQDTGASGSRSAVQRSEVQAGGNNGTNTESATSVNTWKKIGQAWRLNGSEASVSKSTRGGYVLTTQQRKDVGVAVSEALSNTPSVALNSYTDPMLFVAWQEAVDAAPKRAVKRTIKKTTRKKA